MKDHIESPRTEQVRAHCLATLVMVDSLDKWRPQIEEAMRRGIATHSFDDIVDLVLARKLVARFFPDCFFLCMINEYPQAKHFHIFIAGGNMQSLIAAQDEMLEHARQAGCTRWTLNGRPGWARVLKKLGARHAYTMMSTEVPQDGQS